MERIKEQYEKLTANVHNGEILFFFGFGIYLFRYIMVTTMFPFSEKLSMLCIGVFVLCAVLKILLFDSYSPKMLLLAMALLGCGVMIAVSSGYIHPFLWLLAVVAAKDVPFRKILLVYFVLNGAIMVLTVFAGLTGVIENLVYEGTMIENRNSFGYCYTTDFAAHVFFLLLTALYLWEKKLSWYHYVGTIVLAGGIFLFCEARLDAVCILLLLIFLGAYQIIRSQKQRETAAETFHVQSKIKETESFKRTKLYHRWQRFWMVAAMSAMPVLFVLMYLMSVHYNVKNVLLEAINSSLSGRLAFGERGITQYGYSLFGQDVPMQGFGGSETHPEKYFFVDCSYLFVLLRYGIVFLCIVFAIYAAIAFRRKADTALLLVIVLIAISCSIDHHLIEAAYNPFGYALLAGGWKKRLRIADKEKT